MLEKVFFSGGLAIDDSKVDLCVIHPIDNGSHYIYYAYDAMNIS